MIVVEEFGDPVDEGLPAVGGTEDEGGDVAVYTPVSATLVVKKAPANKP